MRIDRDSLYFSPDIGVDVPGRFLSDADRMYHGDSRLRCGYRYLWAPMHPTAQKNGYVAEHRVIAERKLGRLLTATEVVHHVNGDKLENRPENLDVFASISEHMLVHAGDSPRALLRRVEKCLGVSVHEFLAEAENTA